MNEHYTGPFKNHPYGRGKRRLRTRTAQTTLARRKRENRLRNIRQAEKSRSVANRVEGKT